MLMQDALPYTGDYDECNKEFNHIFYSVSNTLKNGRIKYHKNYYINLNPIKIQKNEDYIDISQRRRRNWLQLDEL